MNKKIIRKIIEMKLTKTKIDDIEIVVKEVTPDICYISLSKTVKTYDVMQYGYGNIITLLDEVIARFYNDVKKAEDGTLIIE